MNPNDIRRLLAAMAEQEVGETESKQAPHGNAGSALLTEAVARLTEPQAIQVGDLVRWKRMRGDVSFANKRRPRADEVVIVTARLEEPIREKDGESGSGGAYFREPLDTRVALLHDGGRLVEFWLDARRLEVVPETEPAEDLGALRDAAANLMRPRDPFQPGDLVEWMPGLKNKSAPAEGEVIVVVEQLSEPVYDTSESSSSSPYFREPLDLVCAMIDNDGDLILFYYDSRRFRHAGK